MQLYRKSKLFELMKNCTCKNHIPFQPNLMCSYIFIILLKGGGVGGSTANNRTFLNY